MLSNVIVSRLGLGLDAVCCRVEMVGDLVSGRYPHVT